MNLLQMEYFQTVANASSITQAAKTLNISQSALSIMIKKLEAEIGYPLFEKSGRNIVITPYGKKVLHYSYIFLHEMDDIQREFRELRGEENTWELTIGVTESNYQAEWMLQMMERYPYMHLNVRQLPYNEIYSRLVTGELDFGITSNRIQSENLSSRLLFSQPYQLLVRKTNPLAKRKYVTIEQLEGEPLLALPPFYKNRMIDNLSTVINFRPNVVFEGNNDIMEQMFHAGVGSILTCAHNSAQWRRGNREDYVLLDIAGITVRYEIYLVWLKRRYQCNCAKAFQNYVFDYYHI